ncbi:hypothetical protein AB0P36_31520 [Streptomyces flavidovirens]|uniref:hypothetical protein n=1 Tax=Streptomyces flavidovirens TaxID=67298 RepID=UPI0034164152
MVRKQVHASAAVNFDHSHGPRTHLTPWLPSSLGIFALSSHSLSTKPVTVCAVAIAAGFHFDAEIQK